MSGQMYRSFCENLEARRLFSAVQIVPLTAPDVHAEDQWSPLTVYVPPASAAPRVATVVQLLTRSAVKAATPTGSTGSAGSTGGFSAKIDFQPSGAATYSGYSADVGNTYGVRPNGQTYGWRVSNVGSHFDRNSSRSPDQRYDTTAKMSSSDVWEIKVPNGWYNVDIYVGDAWNRDADHRINVEGKLAVRVKPTYSEKYFGEGHIRLYVSDGKLTLTSASGAKNNALTHVHVSATIAPPGTAYKDNLRWKSGSLNSPISRVEAGVVRVGNKMYFIGGYTDSLYKSVTTRVDILDIKTKAWTRGASIPGPQTHAGVTSDGRYIYSVGGQYGALFSRKGTNESFRYDTQTHQWSRYKNLPEVRFGGALAYHNGYLYFFGGTTADRNTASGKAWKLNTKSSSPTWTPIANLPRAADHMGHAVLDGKVYAIGGEHDHGNSYVQHDDVFAYNPSTNTWTARAKMPLASSHFEGNVVTHDGKLWVFGGQVDAQLLTSQVRSYNPATNTWTRHNSMTQQRKGGASWFDNGKFYYLTGDAYKIGQPRYALEAMLV